MQLCHMSREDITEKMTFEKKVEGRGNEPCGYLGKGCSGTGNSKCKGPEMGRCLVSSKNKETRADCVGGSCRKGGQKDNRREEQQGNQFILDLACCYKDIGLYGESLTCLFKELLCCD